MRINRDFINIFFYIVAFQIRIKCDHILLLQANVAFCIFEANERESSFLEVEQGIVITYKTRRQGAHLVVPVCFTVDTKNLQNKPLTTLSC